MIQSGLRLLILVSAIALALISNTKAEAPALADNQTTRPIYVGIYLHDIYNFDINHGVFKADFEMWAKWRGEFDTSALRIKNAGDVQQQALGQESDRDWHSARWRVRGTLRGRFPVQRFPFDEQKVQITFELPQHEGRLVHDLASSGMAKTFSLSDWFYEPKFWPVHHTKRFRSDLGTLAREGKESTVHRVGYQVILRRPIVTVMLKLFLPLAIIALVALVALFVNARVVEARSAIGITALLSCFAFQFTIGDSIPSVAYATMADYLFLIAYIFSSIALVVTIIAYNLDQRGRQRSAIWLDRIVRTALPIFTLIAVIAALPDDYPPRITHPEALPKTTALKSTRDTVRIGTNFSLKHISGLLINIRHFRLIAKHANDTPFALGVTNVPGIDNPFLEFPAGGGMNVTWRLRKGLKWSDGTPVTARDIMFRRDVSPIPGLQSYTQLDHHTVRLYWSERLASALEEPSMWPAHVYKNAPSTEKGKAKGRIYDLFDYQRKHITPSFGPYVITHFESGKRAVAKANPGYLGPPAKIKGIEVIRSANPEELIQQFEKKKLDILVPNAISIKQLLKLKKKHPEAVHVRPSNYLLYIEPDLDHPWLQQRAVRHALLQAIDRKTLLDLEYKGYGEIAHCPVPETIAAVQPIAYDLAQARKTLSASAPPKRVTLLTSIRMKKDNDQAFFKKIAQDWQAAGLNASFQNVDKVSDYMKKATDDEAVLVVAIRAAKRSSDQARYWELPLKDNEYQLESYHAAYDSSLRELLEREKRSLYPARRRQLQDALFTEYARRLPTLPLVFAPIRMLVHPDLRGWQNNPERRFGDNIEHWYFK